MSDGRVKVTGKPSKYFSLTGTSPEQPELTTDSPETPQLLPLHSRESYSDKRSRHYYRDSDIPPARQDYYTRNASSSRPSRHFTSRSRDRDLSNSPRRRYQSHRERDSSPERRGLDSRHTRDPTTVLRENPSRDSSHNSPSRDNDSPRLAPVSYTHLTLPTIYSV